jgi:hypothetical protein
VALIVIEVLICSTGISAKSISKSSSELTGTPTLPISGRQRMVRAVAALGRQVEGDREAPSARARGCRDRGRFDARTFVWPA